MSARGHQNCGVVAHAVIRATRWFCVLEQRGMHVYPVGSGGSGGERESRPAMEVLRRVGRRRRGRHVARITAERQFGQENDPGIGRCRVGDALAEGPSVSVRSGRQRC